MRKLIALTALAIASAACAANGSNAEPMATPDTPTMKRHAPHVVAVRSSHDFETTLSNLRAAIDARSFKTFTVIDHAAGAASIDQPLRPTTLIIFGNPRGGTPLMQAEQRLGLELPLKILVVQEEEGAVSIIYNDMAHLFQEYGIAEMTGPLEKIEGALSAIASEAGGD